MIEIQWTTLALHVSSFLAALSVFLFMKAVRAVVHGKK